MIKLQVFLPYLGNDGKFLSELVQSQLGNIFAIDKDFPRSRLDQTEQGHGQRRLARARPPHDAHRLPALDVATHVFQYKIKVLKRVKGFAIESIVQ